MIRAFLGEFGLKLRYHVPWVAAQGPVVVECEEGEEALYPFAAERIIVPRPPDSSRHGPPPKRQPMLWFQPEPWVPQGVAADVVVCPRKRSYGAAKNWPCWQYLTARLVDAGLNVFAAGAPDSSYDVPCPRAWDSQRFLDATIEAMRSCRLVIATDAGLAHLAVLCGAPLVLIGADGGKVAPGPVIDSKGRQAHGEYWPIRLEEYYRKANHTGSMIEMMPDGWAQPDAVLNRALEILK